MSLNADRATAIQQIKDALTAADSYSTTMRGFGGANFCAPNAICEVEVDGIYNAVHAPDKAETDGMIAKFSLTFTPSDDVTTTHLFGRLPVLAQPSVGLIKRPIITPCRLSYRPTKSIITNSVGNHSDGRPIALQR